MSHYSHLTQNERYQISALLSNNISISHIARTLNRHRSTIYREIKLNKGLRGYRPKQAHKKASARKSNNQAKLTEFFWCYVEHLIQKYHSPEQINGQLTLLGWEDVASVEAIYLYIYKDKQKQGMLHTFLRCQKSYRKRNFKNNDRRGKLVNRASIEEREQSVEFRSNFGDFEGDTIVGKDHKGVLLTFVDRRSRLTKMKGLPNRKADLVEQTSIELLKIWNISTITFDNGKEFANHGSIAESLRASVYFATPYHSWERGTNENTNGLIRQFFPKDMQLDNIDEQKVQQVEDLLNNRPRKVLGYLTPLEFLANDHSVALHN